MKDAKNPDTAATMSVQAEVLFLISILEEYRGLYVFSLPCVSLSL